MLTQYKLHQVKIVAICEPVINVCPWRLSSSICIRVDKLRNTPVSRFSIAFLHAVVHTCDRFAFFLVSGPVIPLTFFAAIPGEFAFIAYLGGCHDVAVRACIRNLTQQLFNMLRGNALARVGVGSPARPRSIDKYAFAIR